ncbi:DUF221-domain-containing protein [Laetiporus sulphureus 93-53]|uniref:DUF221-domain-containing protein n=1 Tax=Laetiporus sulphureus 93-53 TaxID=1314785 RepID=A0A165B647_9APHY|nr:DUF221-domain-containing protein [Laetiporus sulphureus 93-53]KZT00325.1 DUF221-domain-containing protein [Laetiporus sulphureus 93-53]
MTSQLFDEWLTAMTYDDGEPGLPPGTPPTQKFEGPWFTTQLLLSSSIGLVSFLVFCFCRTRWPLVFAPRTKLKGFSPHEAHAHQAFFGWIIPTIRTSEFSVLQIVGLDAAVLLNFFKMSFMLFSICSVFAVTILMPLNLRNNIDIGDGSEDNETDWRTIIAAPGNSTSRDWLDLVSDANSYLSVHFLFTYLFTILALRAIHHNYKRFIRARQLFSLELVHSISARTVMVTHLPKHLRSERAVAEYFERMDLSVESVSICREVETLKRLLDKRTATLLKLEAAWVKYVGNPSIIDLERESRRLLDAGEADIEPVHPVVPGRRRPTIHPSWFSRRVDALKYLDEQFQMADELVQKQRRTGRFKATHVAFVTFEKMSSAQVAAQTVHAPAPNQCMTHLAPEPRDIVWANISHSPTSKRVRELIVFSAMCLLLLFWLIPTSALASLLSYKEIKKVMPRLGRLIDTNEQVRAIVQNSLPSVAIITLNALLPFLLEALTYFQGYPARSWIEYSLLKKYFLFLLVNVVFIFLVASTYWQLVRDLASSPAKGVQKLADALAAGKARHFFLSYVILQGLGIMPLQLLNFGTIIPRLVYRLFITRTPRDYAELNAPPMINYGVVYPQAILIFVITLLYSVIQPLILIFGALYFGVGYVVYKYKLLFVFYKPYESQGQAWPITFARLIWGVIIFILFMTGIFVLKKSFVLSTLLVPLLAGTIFWSWQIAKAFRPLSKYVNLSSVFEVQRGEDTADVVRLRSGHPVTWSQSNLNHRRYAQNDETLYVAPEDDRTDYSQPPMANWYSGVLNTGKRRYGHPAINGVLPSPWLPHKQLIASRAGENPAVVLTLRKRRSVQANDNLPDARQPVGDQALSPGGHQPAGLNIGLPHSPTLHRQISYDHSSGVMVLPESDNWLSDNSDSDGTDVGAASGQGLGGPDGQGENAVMSGKQHSTYYHHPERRRTMLPQ